MSQLFRSSGKEVQWKLRNLVPATLPERVGTAGIDIFKIAGKSISGWVPSRRTGDPDRIKMPFASKVEQRLSVYLEYHPHVRTYQRGDVSKAFAERITSQRPLRRPTRSSMFTMGQGTNIYPIISELLSTENY